MSNISYYCEVMFYSRLNKYTLTVTHAERMLTVFEWGAGGGVAL